MKLLNFSLIAASIILCSCSNKFEPNPSSEVPLTQSAPEVATASVQEAATPTPTPAPNDQAQGQAQSQEQGQQKQDEQQPGSQQGDDDGGVVIGNDH